MKGLIYKDALTLIKQMRFFLVLILLFSLLPLGSLSNFALVYAAMLPFSAIAYDEQAKWPRLAAMMPYTRGQLVLSKYIIGWAGVLGALMVSILAHVAAQLIFGNRAPLDAQLAMLPMTAALALILIAVVLPLTFRFGVERGRMLSMVVLVLGAIGVALLGQILGPRSSQQWLSALCLFLAIPVNLISILLSRRLYRQDAR